ncbi:MAG: proteasome assembly chaperone 4 family protein [Candidatus Bathyarchaeia archaeon]
MSQVKVLREKMKEKDTIFMSTYLIMRNASLIFLSEEEDRLGTLAVAMPQTGGRLGPPLSSVLLGERNVMLARILAERLAKETGKLALVSVFVQTFIEGEVGPILVKLLEKTLRKEMEKE